MNLLEEGNPVDVVYLDLQKAFGKVPHKRLLIKLKGYGISGRVFEWIRDFYLVGASMLMLMVTALIVYR